MFNSLSVIATVLALSSSVLAAGPVLSTPPSLVVCQPAAISWTATTGPYFLSIIPGNQPSAAPLEQFNATTKLSTVWTVDISAGTSVGFSITDGLGAINYSAAMTILSSSDTSCIGKDATTGGSSAAAGSVAGVTTSSAAASATTPKAAGITTTTKAGAAAESGTSSSAGGSSSSSAPASTSTTGAASSLRSSVGGIVGALFAGLVYFA